MAMRAATPQPSSTPVMTGLTWQEFLDLPEEYHHADLVDGDLYVTAPAPLHQRVVVRLSTALMNWIDAGDGHGEVTHEPAVQITHNRGYLPDLAWYCEDKCSPPDQPPAFDGPPDLVVEVFSPSTRGRDTIIKRPDYFRIGVSELWLIDPDEPSAQLIGAHPDGEQVADISAADHLHSPMLDGFTVRLSDLVTRQR
jgi:Uma2 family endonuclease